MEIILLGTGTAVPTPGRSPACILIKSPELIALLDMGPGAVHKAASVGVDLFQLQYIFLTHLHSDHTLDLVTFLQMNDSTPEKERVTPVRLTGCRGTQVFYQRLMEAFPGISPQKYALQIQEMGEDQIELKGVTISSTHTGHTPDSICYRFDATEGSLVYTGDCASVTNLTSFCTDADVLICECSFPAGWPTSYHMNAEAVGRLAAGAGVKHLVVTHLYPPSLDVDLKSQIQQFYNGLITVAQDGTHITLDRNRQ